MYAYYRRVVMSAVAGLQEGRSAESGHVTRGYGDGLVDVLLLVESQRGASKLNLPNGRGYFYPW
jgi:hypothetical protein